MFGVTSVTTSVSRRISAPPDDIFRILADPRRHPDFDGSGMVRAAVGAVTVTGPGDVFVMAMHFPALGDYEMENHVVEYELDRRIGWEPAPGRGHPDAGGAPWGHRWTFELEPDGPNSTVVTEIYDCSRAPVEARASMDDGRVWVEAMTATLARLDDLCTVADTAG
jgi:uncharacterized protein YndB with AHSA1/START domain